MAHRWHGTGEGRTRIFYLRKPSQTARWVPQLTARDRRAIHHVNFSEYGVLLILHHSTPGAELWLNAVYLVQEGALQAEIALKPTFSCSGGASCTLMISGQYLLVKIRKSSLPTPVHLLYIHEVQ